MKLLMTEKTKENFSKPKTSLLKKIGYILYSIFLLFFSLFVFGIGISWALQNLGASLSLSGILASQIAIGLYGFVLMKFKKEEIKKVLVKKVSLDTLQWGLYATIFVLIANITIGSIFSTPEGIPEQTQAILSRGTPLTVYILPILFAPILEEISFRAGLKYMLVDKGGLNPVLYIILSSVIFGSLHWSSSATAVPHIILTTVMGLIYSIVYIKTKNIYIPILSHMIYNGLVISVAQFL